MKKGQLFLSFFNGPSLFLIPGSNEMIKKLLSLAPLSAKVKIAVFNLVKTGKAASRKKGQYLVERKMTLILLKLLWKATKQDLENS